MGRALRLLLALSVASACACSVVVGTEGLSSGGREAAGDASSSSDAPDAKSKAAPLVASCRALHAALPDAGSGAYPLVAADGGAVDAYCDMESFGGGWTRVTPSMIVEDKTNQEYAPGGPGQVAVTRGTDVQGGIFFEVEVKEVVCGSKVMGEPPGHYFLVGELDRWTQIMATYVFSASNSCWHIFGDDRPRDTNVRPFDLAQDLIGPQQNMARSASGASVPYDGRRAACDENIDNFWGSNYADVPKSARVVLRRFSQDKPAGLAVGTDCGLGKWTISNIHVR